MGSKALREDREKDIKEYKVLKEWMERRDHKAIKDSRGSRETEDRRAIKEGKG